MYRSTYRGHPAYTPYPTDGLAGEDALSANFLQTASYWPLPNYSDAVFDVVKSIQELLVTCPFEATTRYYRSQTEQMTHVWPSSSVLDLQFDQSLSYGAKAKPEFSLPGGFMVKICHSQNESDPPLTVIGCNAFNYSEPRFRFLIHQKDKTYLT